MRRMGPLSQILEALPRGGPLKGLDTSMVDEGHLQRVEAMIDSMTPHERRFPDVINGSRKKRIASGSGTLPADVNRVLKQHKQMQKMMKKMSGKGGMQKLMRQMSAMKGNAGPPMQRR